ncbi:helix-turn-helix domain-containing protein [Cryptosporangium aurantiacum]|uniref:Helix-turn-helix domain-containing protein n=1 Tax=Cryptosporangium aurantiacum TaxID=134849 RepID=A0A1M7Q308_9ACTN|nr:helix-turn-helix transcriptional regulator [Cryptosporangium aurantiacum]SHN24461.1 Helix-turn-helix domain-containing protein [Cryptosporangium aurantiacum]
MAEREAADAQRFGQLLRALRKERGLSLSQLAAITYTHRGSIGNIENGKRLPDRRFAEIADVELGADGRLIASWRHATGDRDARRRRSQLLDAALAESRDIAREAEPVMADSAGERTQELAVQYLGTPPAKILETAIRLRREVNTALKHGQLRSRAVTDGIVTVGRLSGILAYAALDLGYPDAATAHSEAAWRCADLAGDAELKAWTRGTQSLIYRFKGDNQRALDSAVAGQEHTRRGQSLSRLLSAEAQCRAVDGDSQSANRLLSRGLAECEQGSTRDAEAGIFGFPIEKLHYYVGSSLIWLDGEKDAERAVTGAVTAVQLWDTAEPHRRSPSDQALSRIYWTTASLQLGDISGAAEAIRPVLDLPTDLRYSWINRRLHPLLTTLTKPPYADAPEALELIGQIRFFLADP